MASWLIYALGGGFGHLTRASALALAARHDNIRILTNSPYADLVQRALPELNIIALDPVMTVAEGRAEVVSRIASEAPECLIVDTFPRGLGGELADVISSFSGLKILVQRDLDPQYSAAFDLNAFVRKSYDLILSPGDNLPGGLGSFAQTAITDPWLVRSREEVLTRARAREVLRLDIERPCVMVCGSGNSQELGWYGSVVSRLLEVAPECDVRSIAPVCPDTCPPGCWVSYWPALDLYAAADVVVGGGGYNTIYETLACQIPLVARPWPRKYDRQILRASQATVVVYDVEQAVAAARRLLSSVVRGEPCAQFHNGAAEAVARIKELHQIRTHIIN